MLPVPNRIIPAGPLRADLGVTRAMTIVLLLRDKRSCPASMDGRSLSRSRPRPTPCCRREGGVSGSLPYASTAFRTVTVAGGRWASSTACTSEPAMASFWAAASAFNGAKNASLSA